MGRSDDDRAGGDLDEFAVELVARPGSVAEARRAVHRHLLDGRVPDGVIDVARLLTSELVTNAVVHVGGAITLRARLGAGRLRVEVGDLTRARPRLRRAGAAASGGRGLMLVSSLSQRWGVDDAEDPAGKVVWFELDI